MLNLTPTKLRVRKDQLMMLRNGLSLRNLSFLRNQGAQLHFDHCYIGNGIVLPNGLVKIAIIDSEVNVSLRMPNTLEEFLLERTQIKTMCIINIGISCTSINIDRAQGTINISFMEEYSHMKFNDNWSFRLQQNIDRSIDVPRMSNFYSLHGDLQINKVVHMLILTEAEVLGETSLILGKNIKNIVLKTYSGFVRLSGISSKESLLINIRTGSLKLHESSKNVKSMELVISRASFSDAIDFKGSFSKIEMDSVNFLLGCHFNVNPTNLNKIILKNCIGNITYGGIYGLNTLFLANSSLFHLRVLDKSFDISASDTSFLVNSYELILENIVINDIILLSPTIRSIRFENIEAVRGSAVQISNNFESVTLINCIGNFGIPNVSYNDKFLVNLSKKNNFIEIVKISAIFYNVSIENIDIEGEFNVKIDVQNARFTNVTVEEKYTLAFNCECRNLILSFFKGRLNFPNVVKFNRFIAHKSDLIGNHNLFSIPIKHFEGCMVALDHHIPCSQTCSLRLEQIQLSEKGIISMPSDEKLETFSFFNNSIAIKITSIGVIRSVTTMTPLIIPQETTFRLACRLIGDLNEMVLENLQVCDTWQIMRNTTSCRLISITSSNGAVLHVNAYIKNLHVEKSNVNIDISGLKHLEALILMQSPFLYDQRVYLFLRYLRLDGISIETNVDLTDNLKRIIITDSRIIDGFTLRISSKVTDLLISKFHGTIDISGIIGHRQIMLYGTEIIKVSQISDMSDEYMIILECCVFKYHIVLADRFKIVKLINVTMDSNQKVIFNQKCEHIELNSCDINFDCSKASSITHLSLIKISFAIENMKLYPKTIIAIELKKIKLDDMIQCSSHLKSITLHDIEMLNGKMFCVNEICEEVSLFHCVGKFDLSRIKYLRRLVIIPPTDDNVLFRVIYPLPNMITDLELGCDIGQYNIQNERGNVIQKLLSIRGLIKTFDLLESEHFVYLLSRCNNIERCTLHSPKYDSLKSITKLHNKKFDRVKKSCCEELFNDPWANSLFSQYLIGNNRNMAVEKVKLVDIIMNAMVYDAFTFRMWYRMKYLNLEGFNLDQRSVKLMRGFQSLQILILSNFSALGHLFSYLPTNLETLELRPQKDLRNIFLEEVYFSSDIKILREHKCLKNLVLDSCFLQVKNIFNCLPQNLESLKFTSIATLPVFQVARNFKEICLRHFAVELDEKFEEFPCNRDPMTQYAVSVFTTFANFIEFENLIDLTLVLNREVLFLDKVSYRIK